MRVRRASIALLISMLVVDIGCSRKLTANELAESNRQLFEAVDHHDLAAARRLLKQGANIQTTGYNNMSLLAIAASNGDLPMVKLLLERGANPHSRDRSLETPLMRASYDGHFEIVRLLLQQNPDLTEKNAALLASAHGQPAIVILNDSEKDASGAPISREQIMARLEDPWIQTVKLLIDSGANIEATDEYRGPPLVDAASYAQTNTARYLLSRGANLNARDRYGNTALIAAACECAVATMNDAYDVVELLLEKGSDVNAHSNDGTTALMNAAGGFGGSAIVKLLLDHGADPKARDAQRKTALDYAINRPDKALLIRQALARIRNH